LLHCTIYRSSRLKQLTKMLPELSARCLISKPKQAVVYAKVIPMRFPLTLVRCNIRGRFTGTTLARRKKFDVAPDGLPSTETPKKGSCSQLV
jgi:hypothetical protein